MSSESSDPVFALVKVAFPLHESVASPPGSPSENQSVRLIQSGKLYVCPPGVEILLRGQKVFIKKAKSTAWSEAPERALGTTADGDGFDLHSEIERLHTFRQRLLAAVNHERGRIGRDLHDSLGQQLTNVALRMAAMSQDAAPVDRAEIDAVISLVGQAITDTRSVARGLHPVARGDRALPLALAVLAARVTGSGVPCRSACPARFSLTDTRLATELYRIAQEAVSNALRHGKPARILIALRQSASRTTLCVSQKGGSEARQGRAGLGTRIMRYRAKEIGARLSIEDGRSGRRVLCTVERSNRDGARTRRSR